MIHLEQTSFPVRAYFAFRYPLLIFLLVEIIGSTGFWIVSGYKASLLDPIDALRYE